MSVEELTDFIFGFLEEDMRITGAEVYNNVIMVYCDDDTVRKVIIK